MSACVSSCHILWETTPSEDLLTPRVRMVAHAGTSGELNMQPTMAIGWGADHRVVDGAMLAEFSNRWKALLECPDQMLLHLR